MIDLVIFTCQGREHLLQKSFESFKNSCGYSFNKTILAIDGPVVPQVIDFIKPDIIMQSYSRKGYVHNITAALKQINAPYFFWLEDDWAFHQPIAVEPYLDALECHPDWAELVFSKGGPLAADAKMGTHLAGDFYKNVNGFSANPCFCNAKHLQSAFLLLENSPKGDKLGEDGFENFLSKTFEKENIQCVIIDPVDHLPISHEGYLESTPRNWHMTNSLETKTKTHLLTIPAPSIFRKLFMVIKLLAAFGKLASGQLFNNKIYELCFRIIASSKTIGKDE